MFKCKRNGKELLYCKTGWTMTVTRGRAPKWKRKCSQGEAEMHNTPHNALLTCMFSIGYWLCWFSMKSLPGRIVPILENLKRLRARKGQIEKQATKQGGLKALPGSGCLVRESLLTLLPLTLKYFWRGSFQKQVSSQWCKWKRDLAKSDQDCTLGRDFPSSHIRINREK